nr:hypothetical protein [uncultured Rhodopila sp.]
MSINGISGLSVANYAAQTRTYASGQAPADPSAATSPPCAAAAASPPGAATDSATGVGTVGALSPSVLAALMGQNVNLTAGSFAGG